MATIQIPQGASGMTLPNGQEIQFPKGATSFDIPDEMMSASQDVNKKAYTEEDAVNYNPFSETGKLIDAPIDTFASAGRQIGDTTGQIYNEAMDGNATTLGKIGQDAIGGTVHSVGSTSGLLGNVLNQVSDVASASPAGTMFNLGRKAYDYFTGSNTINETPVGNIVSPMNK